MNDKSLEIDPAALPAPQIDETPIADSGVIWEGPPDAQAKLVAAIAKAMLGFGRIGRDTQGQIGNRYFKYAPLANLTDATRVQLAQEGVIVLQPLSHSKEAGKHRLTTIVTGHGAKMVSVLDFEPAKLPNAGASDRDSAQVANLKEYGKQTTYLRRYTYQSTFVLDGDPDADEAGAAAQPRQETKRQPETPQGRQQGKPGAAPDEEARRAVGQAVEKAAQRVTEGAQRQVARTIEQNRPPADDAPPPHDDRDAPPEHKPGVQEAANLNMSTRPPADLPRPPSVPPPGNGAIPQDIASMDQTQLLTALRMAFVELGLNKVQANEVGAKITGKPLAENSREQSERLLVELRTRVSARAGAS